MGRNSRFSEDAGRLMQGFFITGIAAERLMRTIKEEEVDLSEYNDFADARSQIGRFLEDVYMTKRIHSSLGYLTPLEFETAWRLAHPDQTTP